MEPREPNVRVSGADNRAAGRDYIERPRINVRITPPPLHPPGLSRCPSCGRSGIAPSAAACPTCGHDFAAVRRWERQRIDEAKNATYVTLAAIGITAFVVFGPGDSALRWINALMVVVLWLAVAGLWVVQRIRWR